MKKVKFIMLASVILLLCFSFITCGDDDKGNGTKTWTVKFFDGATEMKSVKVNDGETIAVADFPSNVKANHTFNGWFQEAAFTNLFVATTAITKDTNIYGKWTSTSGGKTWIVKFFDGATELVSLTVNDGATVAPADIPSTNKAGFEFEGWFTNQGLTTPWTSNASVTADLNIYGKWTSTGGGGKVPPVVFTVTTSGGPEHYLFVYWVSGNDFQLIKNADTSSFVRVFYTYNPWDPAVAVQNGGWEETWGLGEGRVNNMDPTNSWVSLAIRENRVSKYVDYPHSVASLGNFQGAEWGHDGANLTISFYALQGPVTKAELHYGNCNCASCN